jgi:hypothetical protein
MAGITQEMLVAVHSELGATRGGNPGDYFPLLWIEQEFGVSRESSPNQVSIGPDESGINAFHADTTLRNLHIVSAVWSESRTCFNLPLQQLVDEGMDRIFGDGPPGITPSQFILQLKGRLLNIQEAVDRVFIHFVFTGDPDSIEHSAVHARLREELENRKHLVDRFFGRPVSLVIQVRSASDGRVGAPAHQKATHIYGIRMPHSVVMNGPAGESMRIGFVPLPDLAAIFKEMGTRFFETNIRSILDEDTHTNRSLNHAFESILLEGSRDPLVFAFDHNGVTIYAEKVEENEGKLTITEPRLLNGAQTISAFGRFLEAKSADPRMAPNAAKKDEVSVICKVITDAKPDFVLGVTLNNNRQNPIRPWNLRANDLIQLELQDKLGAELGVYYERQEKAFLALTPEDLEEMDIKENKAVELLKLAQTFLASDGELEKMSRLQEVFEEDAQYASVFGSNRLRADSRHILLAYKIQLRLNRIIREIMERGEKKYFYMRRARNLVWALLIQALLNEPDLAELADKFGRKPGMETEFSDLLAKLASTRVRFLISASVEEHYTDKIEAEKYGFLRTKTIYEDCLKDARDKWNWSRKKLG